MLRDKEWDDFVKCLTWALAHTQLSINEPINSCPQQISTTE